MGLVSFIARRSMLPGRQSGDQVAFSVDLTDLVRRRSVRKYPHRSSDGRMETLYEGADTIWEMEFEPASGILLARLREFADSTASGEVFRVWPYGTEPAPLVLRRAGQGYTPTVFIERAISEPRVLRISGLEQ